MSQLKSDIQYLPGVGPKRALLLKNELEIATFEDLIHLYPFRYIDRSSIQRIAEVTPDVAHVQVMGRVIRETLYGPGSSVFLQRSQAGIEADNFPKDKDGKKIPKFNAAKRLSVIVADSTGEMEMVFFKGIKWNWVRLTPLFTFTLSNNLSGIYNLASIESCGFKTTPSQSIFVENHVSIGFLLIKAIIPEQYKESSVSPLFRIGKKYSLEVLLINM